MRPILLSAVILVLAVPSAGAQITLDRVVVGTPGGTLSNGSIQMDLTLGQAVVGSNLGDTMRSDLGFWWQVTPVTTGVDRDAIPTQYALHQNKPNPFSIRTSIAYAIPHGPVPVFIGIFNLQGGLVRTLVRESQPPGTYAVSWDGRDDNGRYLAAGVYFTRFRAGTYQQTAKTVMLK